MRGSDVTREWNVKTCVLRAGLLVAGKTHVKGAAAVGGDAAWS